MKTQRIRPKSSVSSAAPVHPYAIFTAIDGTLLDSSFDASTNRATIARLLDANVPVIPVSVMTLDELAPIATELGLQHAMVIEAGGAIARWNEGTWQVEPCGPPAETMLDVVRDIEDRSGANLLIYSAMLEASTPRCFSEPFVIESGDLEAVQRAASTLGFTIRRGRRFLHLCRECDEGEAFSRLRDELNCEVVIALGSAAIDAEFLSRADVPIILPGPDGEPDAELLAKVPHAQIAPAPAPHGWTTALEAFLASPSPRLAGRGRLTLMS